MKFYIYENSIRKIKNDFAKKKAIFIIILYLKNLFPSDNFNINNKNVIPSKFILVFDISIKRKYVKRLKYTYILKCLQFHRWTINIQNFQSFTINAKNE